MQWTPEKWLVVECFIHYGRISEKKADILIDTEVRNNGKRQRKVEVESSLVDATGTLIKRVVAMVHLDAGQSKTVNQKIEVRQPHLWSPVLLICTRGIESEGRQKYVGRWNYPCRYSESGI